ncbi:MULTISPECIES: hypothetical protein [Sporosarcina]|uniref:hypothetical protein n=1 Tax=Sporosarcina TaxID=1569 RepID=UPI001E341B08|nr:MULTISPECIES: hypothetical protein [Sporosarcina]GKV65456.1 hypothetical protein NCCP2331_16090 [Sporosarcina sp. NCCP-2331]GLB55580.1 hypothetical protein NCCP2378_13670 [Sporosarcina sp. NCCP-2378]
MAKKSNGLLMATLAAGAYAYFSKKENRDKAMETVGTLKGKLDSFMNNNQLVDQSADKVGHSDPNDLGDNNMVSEGAQTSVHYYNQEIQDPDKKSSEKDGLYKKQKNTSDNEPLYNKDESTKEAEKD